MAKPKFLSRAERKDKKRKIEDAIPDFPGEEEVESTTTIPAESSKKQKRSHDDAIGADVDANVEVRESKKSKKEKKKEKAAAEEAAQTTDEVMGDAESAEPTKRKSKKERKAEKAAREAEAAAKETEEEQANKKKTETGNTATANGTTTASSKKDTKPTDDAQKQKKQKKPKSTNNAATDPGKPRFIVFVGNLPFSATTETITKHFAAVRPISVRHLTTKDTPPKSKGCAFVEFDGYDTMKTCLKMFHHSSFDDGVSPARKINVELTAGGGGKTQNRTAKIEQKNHKLQEERIRRMKAEEEAKLAGKKTKEDADAPAASANAIHPSRRAFVSGS